MKNLFEIVLFFNSYFLPFFSNPRLPFSDYIIIRTIFFLVFLHYFKRIFYRTCPKSLRFSNISPPIYIVTGASAGIGAETAAELCRRGSKVIWAGRDIEKANRLLEKIRFDIFWKLIYWVDTLNYLKWQRKQWLAILNKFWWEYQLGKFVGNFP